MVGGLANRMFHDSVIQNMLFFFVRLLTNELPYPLECNPGALFFVTGFCLGFNSNFEF